MTIRRWRTAAVIVGMLFILAGAGGAARDQSGGSAGWAPGLLPDGQPDIQGMWNNEDANHIPLELPDALAGRTTFSQAELQALVEERFKRTVQAGDRTRADDPGFYALYWFDWYWRQPAAGDWPALLVEPARGKMPALTPRARETAAFMREHLHDTYDNMEAGDRCVSRGVLGMMMPTAYNNAKLIIQAPGYVVIHSEMVHNARIIPIDGRPHVDPSVQQWEGDPRGRWEGTTLVVESTNFRPVANLRAPNGRAMQSARRRMVERFTPMGPDTLNYSVTVDDPETYTEPWTVAFRYTRDNDYRQFEYACHEGNYAVPNSLSGARAEDAARPR